MVSPARLRALAKAAFACTDKALLAQLLCEVRVRIHKRKISHNIGRCAVELVNAILPFACADKIDGTAPDCLDWFL